MEITKSGNIRLHINGPSSVSQVLGSLEDVTMQSAGFSLGDYPLEILKHWEEEARSHMNLGEEFE